MVGSFINSNTNFIQDNDFEDFANYGLFTDENVNCSCISTCLHQQDTKKRKSIEINEVQYTILHHDDGNSSYHCVNSKKNLSHISKPQADFISTMSRISPEWTTKHQLVGIHPLLGLVAYSPEYRVSLINPNILINDGWQLFTFFCKHGDIVKIYNKFFGERIYTIEFIMNKQGQLIANDPADDNGFIPPPINMSAELGSLPKLRQYLHHNYQEMIQEHVTSLDEFFPTTIHTIDQEAQSAVHFKTLHFEGVEDEGIVDVDDDDLDCFRRHRQRDDK